MNNTANFDGTDKYWFWDMTGKIGLFFFGGLYFFSTVGPKNWLFLITTGILMFLCAIFIIYNDYRYEQYQKIKWKLIGLIATIVLTVVVTLYPMKVYSYGLFS